MRQIDAMLPLAEVRDLADEVRRLFDDLDRARPLDRRLLPGVFSPTLDAQETAEAVEIVVDLPGVALDDIRILIKGSVSTPGSRSPGKGTPPCSRPSRSCPKRPGFSKSARPGRRGRARPRGQSERRRE